MGSRYVPLHVYGFRGLKVRLLREFMNGFRDASVIMPCMSMPWGGGRPMRSEVVSIATGQVTR